MPDFKRALRTCLLLEIVRENSIVNAQWEMQFEVKRHILRQENMVGWTTILKNSSNIEKEFLNPGFFAISVLKCQRFVSQSSPNRPFMTDPSFHQY